MTTKGLNKGFLDTNVIFDLFYTEELFAFFFFFEELSLVNIWKSE